MKKNYKVGDLFEIELDAWEGPVVYMYTLMNVSNEYMLARYDDERGRYYLCNGKHSTIDDLFDDFDEDTCILEHYSIDDYELHLIKKGEE